MNISFINALIEFHLVIDRSRSRVAMARPIYVASEITFQDTYRRKMDIKLLISNNNFFSVNVLRHQTEIKWHNFCRNIIMQNYKVSEKIFFYVLKRIMCLRKEVSNILCIKISKSIKCLSVSILSTFFVYIQWQIHIFSCLNFTGKNEMRNAKISYSYLQTFCI